MTPSLEDWMLLAMELHGNAVLHHKRVKRYGEEAWVKAFHCGGKKMNTAKIEQYQDLGTEEMRKLAIELLTGADSFVAAKIERGEESSNYEIVSRGNTEEVVNTGLNLIEAAASKSDIPDKIIILMIVNYLLKKYGTEEE